MTDNQRNKNIDHGWAWVVLIGSFVCYFIADGWSYSFGIIFPEIVVYFNASKGKTAIIPTLMYGIPMLISPIVCALINQYGFRLIGTVGGVFVGLSLMLAMVAQSVESLCLSIGILTSIGLAMVYVASIVSVTCYFEKRRGLATALAVTGSGLGAIVFPILMHYLMETYVWRGMLLITSAIGFQLVPACLLFRAIQAVDDVEKQSKDVVESQDGVKLSLLDPEVNCEQERYQSSSCIVAASSSDPQQTLYDVQQLSAEPDLWYSISSGLDITRREERKDSTEQHTRYNSVVDDIEYDSLSHDQQDHITAIAKCNLETRNDDNAERSSLLVSNAVLKLSQHSLNDAAKPKSVSQIDKTQRTKFSQFIQEMKSIPADMCSKVLLKNGHYLVFCAANFLLFLWISMPYVYIIDRALELKINDDVAVLLLSVIAIGRTKGQLVVGVIGDQTWCDVNILYSIGVVISGLATVLMPAATGYPGMLVCCVVFGVAVSVTSVLPLMCLIDVVGLQRSTSAFGLLQLAQGLGTLLGTPIAGWLYDATGDYEISFYIAGVWLMISGLVLLPQPLIKILKQRKNAAPVVAT